jgi:hypothetical protein
MDNEEKKCPKCDGCGRIADSEDGEPWTVWESLPHGSNIAVVLGVVKPIQCPRCGGRGVYQIDKRGGAPALG